MYNQCYLCCKDPGGLPCFSCHPLQHCPPCWWWWYWPITSSLIQYIPRSGEVSYDCVSVDNVWCQLNKMVTMDQRVMRAEITEMYDDGGADTSDTTLSWGVTTRPGEIIKITCANYELNIFYFLQFIVINMVRFNSNQNQLSLSSKAQEIEYYRIISGWR